MFFTPKNKNCIFFEKKDLSFFLKKNAFLENFFFQNFKKFSAHKKFENFFFNFFVKKFPKKTFFFKKIKLLFIGVKTFFLPKQLGKNIFSPKTIIFVKNKVSAKLSFAKMGFFVLPYNRSADFPQGSEVSYLF